MTGAPFLSLRKHLFRLAKMSPSWNSNARKQHYKVTVDTLKARSKREKNIVQIRKSRREETLVKKRRESVASAPNIQPFGGSDQTISLDENVNSLTLTWEIVNSLKFVGCIILFYLLGVKFVCRSLCQGLFLRLLRMIIKQRRRLLFGCERCYV